MPTYTAIAMDRLIETGGSKSTATSKSIHDSKFERRNNIPNSSFDRSKNGSSSKLERISFESNVKLDDTNGKSSVIAGTNDHWTQISPALYTIPKPTPLPDSPSSYPDSSSSFPPSPYIINHKRRGPRLSKSFTEDDFGTQQALDGEKKIDENLRDMEKELPSTSVDDPSISSETINCAEEDNLLFPADNGEVSDLCDKELLHQDLHNGSAGQNGTMKSVAFNLRRDGEADDFFDPQESLSVRSYGESENNGGLQRCVSSMTPMGEFYDAWEELSSENGPQLPTNDLENELREIRLSLLMEIEKRKQVEEALSTMQTQWQSIREQLSLVGLNIPPNVIAGEGLDNEQPVDQVEDLCQQVHIVRFVSDSIGRGIAKAEVEAEMEAQIESKNFEIARLWDRLNYYEAVNREMSQRNQEAIETARRLRQIRKRRQKKWIWGSIAATITLGSAVLAWSYFSTGREASYLNQSHSLEGDSGSEL
ncbi:uncharacterized protein LOC132046531 isoform X1 [Lycium ferocissimum]|uniref:uncharacterized protein LOC132046531 isoform X1 n=1 Tax=Lycium ferocissimum TaxID=112874 RepID=UPI00281676F7|nr:uncharacterized protein LOC132046531 isoform X1 [Lycium ferocissimum]